MHVVIEENLMALGVLGSIEEKELPTLLQGLIRCSVRIEQETHRTAYTKMRHRILCHAYAK